MAAPKIESIDFLTPLDRIDPVSGDCELHVTFADGGSSRFRAATFDRAQTWMRTSRRQAWWSAPVLFVARLDRDTVTAAVSAMAAEMGGYWLRYYNQRKA
ncbi:MAG: hypothetical protein AAB036_02210 [Elusimicrobiota bacterium]